MWQLWRGRKVVAVPGIEFEEGSLGLLFSGGKGAAEGRART